MLENEKLIELYKIMQTIRKVERKIEGEYKYDEIKRSCCIASIYYSNASIWGKNIKLTFYH